MNSPVRWLLGLVFLALPLLSQAEPFSPSPATPAHLNAIREGGYVLFIRHGPTDSSRPDQVPIDLNNCSTQRPLSDEGRRIMHHVASQFHQAQIPFTDVYTSPLCRARQTAAIIFGESDFTVDQNLMYVAALTSLEKQPIIARTQELMRTPVPVGTNRVLVAHGPNMVEVMQYFPVEGTLVIIRPKGNGFEYVASIEPDHWASLLEQVD